jgi:hypothetical protein
MAHKTQERAPPQGTRSQPRTTTMRNPHRWRNIALAFFASGIFATPAPFLLPEAAAGDTARGLLFIYGVMALLFGALFRHFEVRAQKRLLRGENIIARWRIDAATWRDFVALNYRINQEDGVLLNELTLYLPKGRAGRRYRSNRR